MQIVKYKWNILIPQLVQKKYTQYQIYELHCGFGMNMPPEQYAS